MADVLCLGNLQLDVLCRTITTLPPPGELQMIDDIDFSLSGNGANVAAALARLGISVDLAGYSGADATGEQYRSALSALGVGTDTLLRHPTAGTGTSIITISPDGERSVFFVNGANALFDLATIPNDWLQHRQIVSVSSLFVLPQLTGEAVGSLFSRVHRSGAATVLNICSNIQPQGIPFLKAALAETDYFILNQLEGELLTGSSNPEEMLSCLESHTRGSVILTLGAEGCCLYDEGTFHTIPALPVQATDCTGAGDTFVAGFIAGLLTNCSITDSARLACQVAAYAVTGPGSFQRIPSLATFTQPTGDQNG